MSTIGAVQSILEVEELKDLPDNNGHYVVAKIGPFVTKEAAQKYLESIKNKI